MAGSKAGGENRWLNGFDAWVAECGLRHNHKYSYTKERVEDGGRLKACITCPEHGEFLQVPAKHKAGQGCPRCSGNVVEDHLARLTAAFPDQEFPKVLPSTKVPMTLLCPEHGEFKATINQLLSTKALKSKFACPQCNRLEGGVKRRVGAEELLRRLKKVWPDYSFGSADNLTVSDRITYLCHKHGEHSSKINDLLNGHGCPKCGSESRSLSIYDKVGRSQDANLTHLQAVHGDTLMFDHEQLTRTHRYVDVVCHKHGPFTSQVYSLKAGHGCPRCSSRISRGEQQVVDWLRSLGLTVNQQDRTTLESGELDIVLPTKSVALEYCGLYWHSEELRGKGYHRDKHNRAVEAGIRLITLFEDEWLHKQDAVKAALSSILGVSTTRIYARDTTVEFVKWPEVAGVYADNHLQGAGTPCAINLALKHAGKVVAAMSFREDRFGNNDLELLRYVTTVKVTGGFSKLLAAYKKTLTKGTTIVSYCDLRWFSGDTYRLAGFTEMQSSSPGYWWCKGTKRYSRFAFQKHKLSKRLESFDSGFTEEKNMIANGFWKVWDCGMGKWVLTV